MLFRSAEEVEGLVTLSASVSGGMGGKRRESSRSVFGDKENVPL